MLNHTVHRSLLFFLIFFTGGSGFLSCTISGYEERYNVSEKEIQEIIDETPYRNTLMKRERHPTRSQFSRSGTRPRQFQNGRRDKKKLEEPDRPKTSGEETTGKTQTLSLRQALRLALRNNRDLLNQIEDAALARIDAAVEVHRYNPVLQPVTISHERAGSQFGDRRELSEDAELAMEQRLPAGGEFQSGVRFQNQHGSFDQESSIRPFLSMDVPFLRGGGLIPAQNDLITAVRSRTYARRELKNFRQAFLISILERYFSILQQQRVIENIRNRLRSARQLVQQSNIQFNFGNISKVDVFRAEFQETEARRDLQIAEEQLKLTRDTLKIDLNLPLTTRLQLTQHELEYEPQTLPQSEYIRRVLTGNLLWQNQKEQLEDAKRELVVAHNQTLPRLNFTADVERIREGETFFGSSDQEDTDWIAGVFLELPLDRTFLDQNLHEAVVAYQQQERNTSLAKDQLIQQTREKIIQIRQARFNVEANRQAVELAQKALELLNQQYQQGEVTNRDIIEEQNNLLRSQNNLLRALVDWKIRRLELQQNTGELSSRNLERWLQFIE